MSAVLADIPLEPAGVPRLQYVVKPDAEAKAAAVLAELARRAAALGSGSHRPGRGRRRRMRARPCADEYSRRDRRRRRSGL